MRRCVKIDIDTIGEEGLTLDEPLSAQWLLETLTSDHLFAPTGAGRMRLKLLRSDATIFVRGRATMPLRAPCSRCLMAVDQDVTTRIEVTLVPKEEVPVADSDGQLTDDDVSVGLYETPYIDVSQVLHDEVLLELPMQTLCQTDCRGLCNHCGVNRNDQDCSCSTDSNAGPLGALAKIQLLRSTTNKDN